MGPYEIMVLLFTLTALLAYLNSRYLKLPMTTGLMGASLVLSLATLALGRLGIPVENAASQMLQEIDFEKLLLEHMLAFLLFAGALFVNLDDLAAKKVEIGIFATLGVLASTLLVGSGTYGLARLLGLPLDLVHCFLFGALISPTDPIAVLGILKSAGASRGLETKMTGESLFNDGIGVVVFLVVLELVEGTAPVTAGGVAWMFLSEAVGGAVLGGAAGYAAYRLLRSIDDYQVEIIITLALVMAVYSGALALHLSGPIAIVVAGLLIGNRGRRLAMSETTREHLDTFWKLVDEILNALLFVLIGLEVLVLTFRADYLAAGLLAVPVVLLARFASIGAPIAALRRWRPFSPHAVTIMTWGGLRGGISVALALSIPVDAHREPILTMTYLVVAFSILGQGLTLHPLLRRLGVGER